MNSMTPEVGLRLGWAEAAVFALEQCTLPHANAICAAWLEAAETGGPRHDPFGKLYADARYWAVAAPPHELVAYTLAGMAQAPKALLPLPFRKNVFKALWRGFPDAERAAFLKAVTKGGRA